MTSDEIVDAFFSRIASRDFAGVIDLYDDAVEIWQSHTQSIQSKAENVPHLEAVAGRTNIRHEVIDRCVDGDHVAARCRVHMDLPGRGPFEFPIAIFFTTAGGRITRLHEYVDSGVVAELTAALMAPAAGQD